MSSPIWRVRLARSEHDPLQEWGAEAAVVVLIAAILGAVAIVIYAVMQGNGLESAALPALGVAAAGGVAAFVIMRLRKRRERANRPAWMAHTQQWREELQAKLDSEEDNPRTGLDSDNSGWTERVGDTGLDL